MRSLDSSFKICCFVIGMLVMACDKPEAQAPPIEEKCGNVKISGVESQNGGCRTPFLNGGVENWKKLINSTAELNAVLKSSAAQNCSLGSVLQTDFSKYSLIVGSARINSSYRFVGSTLEKDCTTNTLNYIAEVTSCGGAYAAFFDYMFAITISKTASNPSIKVQITNNSCSSNNFVLNF